jgi:uncharacterized membrane protein
MFFVKRPVNQISPSKVVNNAQFTLIIIIATIVIIAIVVIMFASGISYLNTHF